jgi:hypothetical protein
VSKINAVHCSETGGTASSAVPSYAKTIMYMNVARLYRICSSWMLQEDAWIHVGVVFGTTKANLYINGQVAKQASIHTGTRLSR